MFDRGMRWMACSLSGSGRGIVIWVWVVEWQVWSERLRRLLPPIKALRGRKLVRLEELVSLQEEVHCVVLGVVLVGRVCGGSESGVWCDGNAEARCRFGCRVVGWR